MNTRPSRSLFRKFIDKSIGSLAKFFCIHNTPKRGGGPYSSGCRSFFYRRRAVVWEKWGVHGGREKWARSCDLSVSEKMGRRVRKKKGWRRKENAPWGLNSPHSKGCWVFIYSGRGQSTFDYSTVTSRNPLQLLEHPRF